MSSRVMFDFSRANVPGGPMTLFRVVDRSASRSSSSQDTNAVVERFDGYDAMDAARWVDAGADGVRALLNELIYFSVVLGNPMPSMSGPFSDSAQSVDAVGQPPSNPI